jgi:hypothetical protein
MNESIYKYHENIIAEAEKIDKLTSIENEKKIG